MDEGTYTIKQGTMSGMDVNGTTYSENDTITIDSDIEMTKHTYSLPSNWEQQIENKYPLPEIVPGDEPDEPDEPSQPSSTKLRISVEENGRRNFIIGAMVLMEGETSALVDWGDDSTTNFSSGSSP